MSVDKLSRFSNENELIAMGHQPIPMAINLTKCEYFAAMALQGMLANGDCGRLSMNQGAFHAVAWSNALIEAIDKYAPANP